MAWPYNTPGINPDAPDPFGGQQVLPPVGQQGSNRTSLPDWVANNPEVYGALLGYRQYDPLKWAEALGGFKPEGIGASNGLVVYRKAQPGKAAVAAAVAEYANRRQMESLRAALEGRQPQPSMLGQGLGALGNVVSGASGGAPGPEMSQDQWGRIFGGTGVTPEQWGGQGGWRGALGGILRGIGGYL